MCTRQKSVALQVDEVRTTLDKLLKGKHFARDFDALRYLVDSFVKTKSQVDRASHFGAVVMFLLRKSSFLSTTFIKTAFDKLDELESIAKYRSLAVHLRTELKAALKRRHEIPRLNIDVNKVVVENVKVC